MNPTTRRRCGGAARLAMLPRMNMADPEPAERSPAEAPHGPAQTSFDDLKPPTAAGATADVAAMPRGCPLLLSEGGGWRLDMPSRDHRCAAVTPPAPLSLEKQSRLCLTDRYSGCATYLASAEARMTRLGMPSTLRATRWGLARTTTIIEDAGGMRARALGILLERRRWPAIPAVILVTTLVILGFSGLRGGNVTPVATASPTHGLTTGASSVPTRTTQPASAASSAEPTVAPTTGSTAKPTSTPRATTRPPATFRTYKVNSGDTLSGIASKFGTTSRAIADLNGFAVGTTLHIGQVLKIPNAAP